MRTVFLALILIVILTLASAIAADPAVLISGELKQWHEVTLTLDGPSASGSETPRDVPMAFPETQQTPCQVMPWVGA